MKIEPAKIAELYEKHKFVPQKGNYIEHMNGQPRCCPLSILYIDEKGEYKNNEIQNVYELANKKFGEDFTTYFWKGFDGNYFCEHEGWENGKAVREYLEKIYGPIGY